METGQLSTKHRTARPELGKRRTTRPPVISSLHNNDVVPPGLHSRNLDGGLDGLATRVPEEETGQLALTGRFEHRD
jgi:hypothetical protein